MKRFIVYIILLSTFPIRFPHRNPFSPSQTARENSSGSSCSNYILKSFRYHWKPEESFLQSQCLCFALPGLIIGRE